MARNGVSAKQQKAIAALLTSSTIEEAAAAAKVGHRTLTRWLTDPVFLVGLRRAQDQAINAAVSRLVGSASEAAGVLATIAGDENEKASPRGQAARALLSNMMRLIEVRDLAERIEALEERAANG